MKKHIIKWLVYDCQWVWLHRVLKKTAPRWYREWLLFFLVQEAVTDEINKEIINEITKNNS